MRDSESDSKAFSTKSSTAIAGSAMPAGTSGQKGASAKENASNQRRKKSYSRGSGRRDLDDTLHKIALVKEFIEQLVEKACDIAEAEE